MTLEIHRLNPEDDFALIVESIDSDDWGDDNDLDDYSESALREIAGNPDAVLLIASRDGTPVGLALATHLLKPYGNHWLYVDELDTHPDFRRQGVARALMDWLFEYARERGLEEVWLGADADNDAANAFYESLRPESVDPVVGYTFTIPHRGG